MKSGKENTSINQSILVIGLDGVGFDIISPMIDSGRLPNISKLINSGSRGNLHSTIPPLSPVAWTSLSTGLNPGNHGILDFLNRKSGSYEVEIINASRRRAMPIWERLSSLGKRVVVINVPMTYPPDAVNGFMISGMDSPKQRRDFMYPASLFQELESKIGGFKIESIDFRYMGNKQEKVVEELFAILENRFHTANYLMDRSAWDFFFIVFEATDRVQHNFWNYMMKNSEKTGISPKYKGLIHDVYERVDEKIGSLLKKIGAETSVMIVSDHGFTSIQKGVLLNRWLSNQSYLMYRRRMLASKNIKRKANEIIRKGLKRIFPEQVIQKIKSYEKGNLSFSFNVLPNIDMKRTKAFCLSSYGVYLNLKGRDPLGTVAPGNEYENLREKIMSELLELKDPSTGDHVIQEVHKREDVVWGEFADYAPDIYILWNPGYFFMGERQKNIMNIKADDKEIFSSHNWSGQHALEGIIIMKGPGIKKNHIINKANIIDVAPTILYMLDQDIPQEMDGKILMDAINEEYLIRKPIKYSRSAENDESQAKIASTSYSPDEADDIRKRLQGLGYID